MTDGWRRVGAGAASALLMVVMVMNEPLREGRAVDGFQVGLVALLGFGIGVLFWPIFETAALTGAAAVRRDRRWLAKMAAIFGGTGLVLLIGEGVVRGGIRGTDVVGTVVTGVALFAYMAGLAWLQRGVRG